MVKFLWCPNVNSPNAFSWLSRDVLLVVDYTVVLNMNWTWRKHSYLFGSSTLFWRLVTQGVELQLPNDQLKGGAFCVCYSSAKDTVTLHLTTPVLSKFSPLIATFCFFLSSCLFHLHFLTLHSQDSHQLRLVALSSIFTVCFSGFLLLRWQGKKTLKIHALPVKAQPWKTPPFWWYFPWKMGIFHGYVGFQEYV